MSTEAPESGFRVYVIAADPDAAYEAAADAVAAGEVIVLPTDTVYGVGADAFSPEAVQRLLDAKQRGRDMPPPVLVAEVEMIRSLSARYDDVVLALAEAFWPGPLTLILRSHPSLQMDLGDRLGTIAVRVPDHDFTRELLRQTGPLAVSSANVSGQDAALSIADATAQLGDAVSVYLDAGAMAGPVPSTILDLSGDSPRVLRAGRLSVADLNRAVPGLLVQEELQSAAEEAVREEQDEAPVAEAEAEPEASEAPTQPDADAEPEASEDATQGDPGADA